MNVPSGHRIASAVLLVVSLSLVGCSDLTVPPLVESSPSFALGNGAAVGDIAPTDLGTLGGTYAYPTDINDHGWVVGFAATAGGDWSAFLVVPDQPMEDLAAGPRSEAHGINNNGQIVGFGQGADLGFFWDAGTITALEGNSGCGSAVCRTYPRAVNDRGVVVGQLYDASSLYRAASWFTQNTTTTFVAQGLPGGLGGVGNDINNDGELLEGRIAGQALFRGQQHAALWSAHNSSTPAQRGPLPGDGTSGATAINDNTPAQIVGWSQAPTGYLRRPFFHGGAAADTPTPLALLTGFTGGEAQDINRSQIIVGWLITEPWGLKRAAIWPSPTSGPILLRGADDNLEGASTAVAINERCQVVGTITNGAGQTRGALWDIGGCDGGSSDPNAAPVASDEEYATDEDVTLDVAAPGVLANDTDGDGDPLTAVLEAGPANGTLTLNGNGSFTYVPAADFFGTDGFSYRANDGTDDSNIATVAITVNDINDPPTADPLGPYQGAPGVPVFFVGAGSDIDGTILSYDWDFGDSHTGTGAGPSHTYAAGGTYTVSLTVTDDDGASHTQSTTATISEGGPAEAIGSLMVIVADLGDGGPLDAVNTNALTVKLEAALKSFEKRNENAAVNQLEAFINEVEALVQSGRLDPVDADSLINAAKAIIGQILGQSGG